jgi:hypothetical protein
MCGEKCQIKKKPFNDSCTTFIALKAKGIGDDDDSSNAFNSKVDRYRILWFGGGVCDPWTVTAVIARVNLNDHPGPCKYSSMSFSVLRRFNKCFTDLSFFFSESQMSPI